MTARITTFYDNKYLYQHDYQAHYYLGPGGHDAWRCCTDGERRQRRYHYRDAATNQKANKTTPADRALRNALAGTSINQLATNADNVDAHDTHFSNEVPGKGITDQKSSGRCWLFTGLNVMRAKMIQQQGLGSFQFSQSYNFFYDQLEKSNLFLQAVIDNASKPMDDKLVEWLFKIR